MIKLLALQNKLGKEIGISIGDSLHQTIIKCLVKGHETHALKLKDEFKLSDKK